MCRDSVQHVVASLHDVVECEVEVRGHRAWYPVVAPSCVYTNIDRSDCIDDARQSQQPAFLHSNRTLRVLIISKAIARHPFFPFVSFSKLVASVTSTLARRPMVCRAYIAVPTHSRSRRGGTRLARGAIRALNKPSIFATSLKSISSGFFALKLSKLFL